VGLLEYFTLTESQISQDRMHIVKISARGEIPNFMGISAPEACLE